MQASLTWLIGNQRWSTLKQRLNNILDEAPCDDRDCEDVTHDTKAPSMLCYAIHCKAPAEILLLLLECHPTLLQKNSSPIQFAVAVEASEGTIKILQSAALKP
jgi:hypothetical protein